MEGAQGGVPLHWEEESVGEAQTRRRGAHRAGLVLVNTAIKEDVEAGQIAARCGDGKSCFSSLRLEGGHED